MRHFQAAFLILLAATTSCTDRLNRPSGRPDSPEKTILVDKLFYSAVKYPDSYRWQDHISADETPCELLFADNDGVIARYKAGKGGDFSAESYNHKVLDGHLYDFRREGGRTWIREDGKGLLDWEREEHIIDIIHHQGKLHSLSSIVIGADYRYRIDGLLELMGNELGLESGFYHDFSSLVFNLAGSETETKTRPWYFFRDERIYPVINQFNDMDIVSMSVLNGSAHTIGNGSKCSWRAQGNGRVAIWGPAGMKTCVQRFTSRNNQIFIEGSISDEQNSEDVNWTDGGKLFRPQNPLRRICSCVPLENEYDDGQEHSLWVLGKEIQSGSYVIYHDGVNFPLPQGYYPAPTPRMLFFNDVLCVNLVDSGGKAAIMYGDQIIHLGFNGYVDDMGVAQVEVLSKSEY
ncbi:MAG: hypothetical protein MJY67_08130 [Bacteroidales bacterium]|nr:hypothetical protein [Bacteroidales bacterium]